MNEAIRLDGATRIFMIVGDPIVQAKSPRYLSENLARRGVNAVMIPAEVPAGAMAAFMTGVAGMANLDGLIATVPHKPAMLALCARATERAVCAGSANILVRAEVGWAGDNTDGQGYLDGIAAAGGVVEGRRVLLAGAGGAGSAIAFEFLARGVAELAIHDVDAARRDALLARLAARFPGRARAGGNNPAGFDVVANATPVGMRKGDGAPVRLEGLSAGQVVADVVTGPEPSALIATARRLGCVTLDGAGMFAAQENVLVDGLLHGITAAMQAR